MIQSLSKAPSITYGRVVKQWPSIERSRLWILQHFKICQQANRAYLKPLGWMGFAVISAFIPVLIFDTTWVSIAGVLAAAGFYGIPMFRLAQTMADWAVLLVALTSASHAYILAAFIGVVLRVSPDEVQWLRGLFVILLLHICLIAALAGIARRGVAERFGFSKQRVLDLRLSRQDHS